MGYAYGLGLLFAAILVIAVGRRILNRPGVGRSVDDFGVAESLGLLFVLLLALGLIEIVETAAAG